MRHNYPESIVQGKGAFCVILYGMLLVVWIGNTTQCREYPMRKLLYLLSRAEIHILLASLSLVVFSWPFFAGLDNQSPARHYLYFFLPWGIIILLLLLISRSYNAASRTEQNQEKDESDHA
jgi:hypothetical protein